MEKKNQKLSIIVGVLLFIVGVSFAYFVTRTIFNGIGANTKVTTASIHGSTINVEGTLEFDDPDILAVYTSEDGINYTETTDMPQSGYALNTTKSTCNNGAIPNWLSYGQFGIMQEKKA